MWKWGKHGSNEVGGIYDLLVRKISNPCCVYMNRGVTETSLTPSHLGFGLFD